MDLPVIENETLGRLMTDNSDELSDQETVGIWADEADRRDREWDADSPVPFANALKEARSRIS